MFKKPRHRKMPVVSGRPIMDNMVVNEHANIDDVPPQGSNNVIEVVSGSAIDDVDHVETEQNPIIGTEPIKMGNIPPLEADTGWETIKRIELNTKQGMALKLVKYQSSPGSQLRLRSECRRGASYNATIWSVTSSGIPRTESLVGHDIGGHEVSAVLLQRRAGHDGEATVEYDMFG